MTHLDVPFSKPDITEDDVMAVARVVRSGRLALGPEAARFERLVADYVGVRHAIAVSSGTAGLHLAVVALGIGREHEVITSPLSFVPSANCFVQEGARPVFVDIEPLGLGPAPEQVARALTGRTRAILFSDLFHQPVDAEPLRRIAEQHDLPMIEDACEALGAECRGRRAGSLGDIGVFGFYPNKQITTGEGGMVVSNDDELAARCRSLRNQGRDTHDAWLSHSRIGFNYRLDEMSAALGVSQMTRVDSLLAARERVAALYRERLAHSPFTLPRIAPTTTRTSWFVFTIQLPGGADRSKVMRALEARGVPTRTYFDCIHLQRPYRERFGFREGQFPRAEAFARQNLALPFFPGMSEAEVDHVCASLETALPSAT